MTENCLHTNPLRRDGTSQAQRTLKALLPEYVSVDERSLDDLRTFSTKYAEEILYYNETDTNVGGTDWVAFFTRQLTDDQKNSPHYSLFMAFLEMFQVAQNDLNGITERHLDFYYRDVLGLSEKAEIPDQVHAVFNLARNTSSTLLSEGQILRAGKDDTGVELEYIANDDTVINPTVIKEKRSLFVDKPTTLKPSGNYRIYSSPIANSADGKGAEIESDQKSWRTFGYIESPFPNPDRDHAIIGFAIASPILRLAEGNREIKFTINMAPGKGFDITSVTTSTAFTTFNAQLQNIIQVEFSGEEWIKPDTLTVQLISPTVLEVKAKLNEENVSVIDYDAELLLEPFKTDWPVARITLSNTADNYTYKQMKNAVVNSIDIKVEVDKVRDLIVQNDNGTQDPTNTFQPFGGRPTKGSNFYIGSNEIFGKNIDTLEVGLEWNGLPDNKNGFEGHYWNYSSSIIHRKNSTFTVNIDILSEREWVPAAPADRRLFDDNGSFLPAIFTKFNRRARGYKQNRFFSIINLLSPTNGTLKSEKKLTLTPASIQNALKRNPKLEKFNKYNNLLKQGFIRLKLTGTDFGHKDYGTSLSLQMIKVANNTADEDDIPNEPYTPEINEIYLKYTSSETLQMNTVVDNPGTPSVNEMEVDYNNRIEQFFFVQPFGLQENHKYDLSLIGKNTTYLLPQFNDEGSLFLGLDGVTPPSTQSVLFQVAEGSNFPWLPTAKLKISYLRNNHWIDLQSNQITLEKTNNLLRSGIIRFDVPSDATRNNTRMPENLFWIKISVAENVRAVCNLIDVLPNAVLATYQNNGNDPDHLRLPLESESISKLSPSNPSISKVSQPYSSFGGHIKEQRNEFITRISERLRHKNRAINLWDYERIALEAFPSIYKVKCIGHTRFEGVLDNTYSEAAPGHVSLVVVSNVQNDNAADPLQPRTNLSRLTEIKQFLEPLAPPCVKLHVQNPLYEQIRVRFHVKFHDGLDKGFFRKKLNEDLIKFLSPWTYKEGADISFGGTLHKSIILNHVEERDYVDYLSCFEMDQLIPGSLLEDRININEAETATSSSIFSSAPEHIIQVIETETCDECHNNVILTAANLIDSQCSCSDPNKPNHALCDQIGIGTMILGSEGNKGFIVQP